MCVCIGFQNNTDAACAYCKTNGTDACCSSISSSCKNNLSAGAIAGIVIGSVAAAALCALAAFYFCHRRKRVRKDNFWFTTYVRPKDHYAHTAYAINPQNPSTLNQQSLIHHTNNSTQPTSPTEPPSPLTPITPVAVNSRQDEFANVPLNGRTSPPLPPLTTTVYPDVFGDDPPPTTEDDDDEGGAFLTQPKADDMYIVVHPYPPQMGDELALHNGDIICLALNFDDGWALGFNAMTGLKGAFPTVCVAPIPPEMLDEMAFAQKQQQEAHEDEPSSKTLIEEEERNPFKEPENPFANPHDHPWQPTQERKRAEPKYSLYEMNRIRESVRRSMSLGTFNLPRSPELTQHSHIPKRTASMRTTTYGYSEAESPTSPTHNTPFFDVTSPSSAVVRPRNPPSTHHPSHHQQKQQQQEDIYELHEQQHDSSYHHHRTPSSSSSINSPWTNG